MASGPRQRCAALYQTVRGPLNLTRLRLTEGFYAAIQSVFDIHQNGHGHALSETGMPIMMMLDGMKEELSKPVAANQ